MSAHQGFTTLGTIGALALLAAAAVEWRSFARSRLPVHAFGALSSLLAAMALTASILA